MEPNGGEDQKASLEKKANEFMQLSLDESEALMRIVIPVQRPGESTFYENFALRGIRVDRVEPGLIVCTFKVPPRLTDRAGNLANGAIANLVDVVGSYVTYTGGLIRNVSVDISISYMSTAKLDDRAGNLAQGAIANLVDVVGASVAYIHGLPMNVSVDISVSYMSKAKLDDELEITSQRLGRRGGYSGAIVILRNKATGEVVAEGRHSMFRPAAKL
ncbi:uncharacterized protein LOC112201739 isoform X1 [Rosa chinensis]|uniref:uncharacterized protein LOC112201739 isoform X1 n=1 Tax=Rosa chinensis TaxID=74649 RepID=UPI001AD8BBC9|nr:uncharacterized protein LOC112201739 isoform X1 [Rosa chinensis]